MIENNASQDTQLSTSDIISLVLRNWKWYVLSVVICIAAAFFYIKSSQRVYQRQATVLIKSRQGTSQMASEMAAFKELGISSAYNSVDNEILVFKSKRLMTEVVRRLKLDVDYTKKDHFTSRPLYKSTPVTLSFPDSEENSSFSLDMTPMAGGVVKLSNFEFAKERVEREVTAHVGDTVNTPIGRVVVVENLGVSQEDLQNVVIKVTKRNMQKLGIAYSNKLVSAAASKLSSIIQLTLNDNSAKRAEDVLNTLVEVYNEDAIADKNRVADKTEAFLDEQLFLLEGDLNDVDMVIANYKASNQLTDIKADASAFRSTTSAMEQLQIDLQNQKAVAQYILEYIQRSQGEDKYDVIPNNAGVKNAAVEALISEYNAEALQREKLKLDAGENNPQVQDLTNSIDQLRQRIVASISNLIQSVDIEIANISKMASANRGRLIAVPTQQKTVTSVERQQTIKEQLYLYLLNKRQENALAKNITESNARLLDPAMGSDLPIAPKKSKIALLALIMGLLIPSAIIYLLVVSDNKVRSRKDLKCLSEIPLVGEIPQVEGTSIKNKLKKSLRGSDQVVVSKEAKDPVSENIRIMRTNIHYLKATHGDSRVLMFTSTLPGSGKTFLSANFGLSLALTGKKVVMVDLDIRRASLSSTFGHFKVGVTDYLCDFVNKLDDVIVHTSQSENLDLIPAGHMAPNPSEILMSESLEKLIEELKKRYDYVIIDSVPVNVVADALIVNRVADLTLFVVRAGNLDRRHLPDVLALYEEKKLKNMSIVLNGVSDSHIYGNGHYYGYGRGYHNYYGKSKA